MSDATEQTDWIAETNLAGVAPAGGRVAPDRTYKCKTTAVVRGLKKDGSGKVTYRFEMEVVEPSQFGGYRIYKYLGDVEDLESKGRGFWVTAAMAHGVERAALEKGTIRLSPAVFVGKTVYLYVGPEKPPKGYTDNEFLAHNIGEANMKREKDLPAGQGATAGANVTHSASASAADPFAA